MSYGITDEQKFYSHELEEELDVIIYLPPQYTPFHEYPICIAQDGKDYFQLGRVVRILDELINDGEIEPIIFVGIPYKNVSDRRENIIQPGQNKNITSIF